MQLSLEPKAIEDVYRTPLVQQTAFWSRVKATLGMPVIISSVVMFALGMAYCYFIVFGMVFKFIAGFSPDSVNFAPDIDSYFSFVLTMFFAFGVAFESRAKELGLHLNIRARFPSIRAGFETMKRIGGGMLVLRSSYAAQEPDFQFVELSDVWRRLDNRICVVKDRTRLSPAARELTEFLIGCAKRRSGQTFLPEPPHGA